MPSSSAPLIALASAPEKRSEASDAAAALAMFSRSSTAASWPIVIERRLDFSLPFFLSPLLEFRRPKRRLALHDPFRPPLAAPSCAAAAAAPAAAASSRTAAETSRYHSWTYGSLFARLKSDRSIEGKSLPDTILAMMEIRFCIIIIIIHSIIIDKYSVI